MALLTADDIKTELSISTTDYDTLLSTLASAVQSLFDELTGRTSESTTHTEYHDAGPACRRVFLKNYPVTSVTSLHDDPDWEYSSSDLVDSSDYVVDNVRGIIIYNSYFFEGDQNIKVVYVAGYTSLTFPSSWKEIWVRQACEWFRTAKNKDHGKASINQGGASTGSMTKKDLVDGLMQDFKMLVDMERNYYVSV